MPFSVTKGYEAEVNLIFSLISLACSDTSKSDFPRFSHSVIGLQWVSSAEKATLNHIIKLYKKGVPQPNIGL